MCDFVHTAQSIHIHYYTKTSCRRWRKPEYPAKTTENSPTVTGNHFTCIECHSNPGRNERKRAFSGNTIVHSAVRARRNVNPSNADATFVQSKGRKDFRKSSRPCHVGIPWIALTEYPQMSTHVPGFQSYFNSFKSFCIGQISHQQHKG